MILADSASLLLFVCFCLHSPTTASQALERQHAAEYLRDVHLDANSRGVSSLLPLFIRSHASRVSEIAVDTRAFDPVQRTAGQAHGGRSGRVSLRLFADVDIEASETRLEQGISGGWTWYGKVTMPESGWMTLSISSEGYMGTIEAGKRRFLLQGSARGRGYAKEVSADPIPDDIEYRTDGLGKAATSSLQTARKVSDSTRRIDLLVLYSPAVNAAYSGSPGNLINNLVANLNASFANSQVNGWARVVRSQLWANMTIEPRSTQEFSGFIDLMASNAAGTIANFGQLAALRNQYGADVVVLLTNAPGSKERCGAATSLDAQTPIPSQAAFAVVDISCASADHTFTHEIGHILGGNHDQNSYRVFGLAIPDAIDPYAFGFFQIPGQLRTLMGSSQWHNNTCSTTGCMRLNYWSDPFNYYVTANGYYPLGSQFDDPASMADVLDGDSFVPSTIAMVANYRIPLIAAPSIPGNVFAYAQAGQVFNISWSHSTGTVEWYELQQSASPSFSFPDVRYTGLNNYASVVIMTCSGPSVAYFRLRACNSGGCSPYHVVNRAWSVDRWPGCY
jgi:hypothetical protein